MTSFFLQELRITLEFVAISTMLRIVPRPDDTAVRAFLVSVTAFTQNSIDSSAIATMDSGRGILPPPPSQGTPCLKTQMNFCQRNQPPQLSFQYDQSQSCSFINKGWDHVGHQGDNQAY